MLCGELDAITVFGCKSLHCSPHSCDIWWFSLAVVGLAQ